MPGRQLARSDRHNQRVTTTSPLAGDALIPGAPLSWDRHADLPRRPIEVWPWLEQLGKGRAGWYLPRSVERFLPPRGRALHRVDPAYGGVRAGQRVPDYGPDGWFEAWLVDPPHTLVWWSERGDLRYSWALVLSPRDGGSHLQMRLRFSRRIGRRAPAVMEAGADLIDRTFLGLMVAGLRERLTER